MGTRDIFRILGQTAGLVGRLALVLPELFWLRWQAVMAFERELKRAGVPRAAQTVLATRYRDALPLNPLPYIRAMSAGSPGTQRGPERPAWGEQCAVRGGGRLV